MLKHKRLSMAVALALASASTANAGIGFKAGEWDIDFSGNVNGFATYNDCATKNVAPVAGGLACNQPPDTKQSTTSIESGLLPSALVFSAKSRQANMDVGVTIGLYPTLRTGGPGSGNFTGNNSLGDASINVRQNFLTFGDASWGNVKIGRDIGLFGSDAILSDMTLLGVGSGAAFLGGNTTLGRIGVGYIYTDWIPQITYTSPGLYGFKVAGGMFQTFGTYGSITGLDENAAALTSLTHPGVAGEGELRGQVQHHRGRSARLQGVGRLHVQLTDIRGQYGHFRQRSGSSGQQSNGWAWDAGLRANIYGFELVGYYYDAQGIGTTGIGSQGVSYVCPTATCPNGFGASLEQRKSDGWYAQLTYKFQDVKIGYSYGQSNLKQAGNERLYANGFNATNGNLLKQNASNVVGVYYALTKSLNLVGEWVNTEAEAHNGNKYNDNAYILGAILFF